MIELRLLRYFIAVAETEHVGRAAALLHISQSPLSRQIRQLEDTLGVRLFERVRRGIALTEAGRRMLEPARDLVRRADGFAAAAKLDAATAPPRLAIGFVTTALSTGVLPAALRTLRSRHPALEIELRHASSDAQLALVRAGDLDLAFVHSAIALRGLVGTRVVAQAYRLAVARDAPLATRALRPDTLAATPWVALRSSDRRRERWLDACAASGFTPQIAVEVGDHASALALVGAGVGVTLVPESLRASAPRGIVFRAVPWLRLRSELWAVHQPLAEPIVAEMLHAASSHR
jgi:DNA-binding transcriptional LysR family regulator